jgi:FMN phosphatase YigB (HAD superfamily)
MPNLLLVDLDDTIYDRACLRPQALLRPGERAERLGLGPDEVGREFEFLSDTGPVFERLGLRNPRHYAGAPDALASAVVLFGQPGRGGPLAGVNARWQQRARRDLARASELVADTLGRSWTRALGAELDLARLLARPGGITRLAPHAARVRRSPEVLGVARALARAERWIPYPGFLDTWRTFERSGVCCVIASEGEHRVQLAKLRRLGLGSLAPRLLTTGRAANPPGAGPLRARVHRLIATLTPSEERGLRARLKHDETAPSARGGGERSRVDELLLLFPFRWMLDRAARKTPEFYARVLHATASRPTRPIEALDSIACFGDAEWAAREVKAVMIGDNPEKDVVPVRELLGARTAWTVLLNRGIRGRGPAASRPEARPVRRFESWDEILRFARSGFSWSRVRAIRRAPRGLEEGAIPAPHLALGDASRFTVVRRLSAMLEAHLRAGASSS